MQKVEHYFEKALSSCTLLYSWRTVRHAFMQVSLKKMQYDAILLYSFGDTPCLETKSARTEGAGA